MSDQAENSGAHARDRKHFLGALALGTGASAVLFVLAQPPFDAWWIAPFALAPWLRVLPTAGPVLAALSGVVFGTVSGAAIASWLVQGMSALGASAPASFLALVGVPLVVAGIPWAIFGVSLGWLARGASERVPVIAGVSLGIIDLARSHGAWGVPWGLLGHSQWSVPGVAQLAALGGVPLISAVLAWCSGAAARCAGPPGSARARVELAAGLCGWLCLLLAGVAAVEAIRARPSGPTRSLLVVQPNLPVEERWNPLLQESNLGVVTRLTSEALRAGGSTPDAVVWPESTLTKPIEDMDRVREHLTRWLEETGLPLLAGMARRGDTGRGDRYRNSALWWSPRGEMLGVLDKEIAVPLIESESDLGVPAAVWEWLGVPREGALVEQASESGPLEGPMRLVVLLCYEVVFPGMASSRREPESQAILNLSNDSWFGTGTVSRQQIAYGAFRAIEQRLPFVRAAHGGESIAIDPLGRVVASLPHGATGTLELAVRMETPASLRERAVIGAVGLGPAMVIFFLGRVAYRRRG